MSTVEETAIRPFNFTAEDEALVDLRQRIVATQVARQGNGFGRDRKAVSLRRMRELARYWATDYDWRKVEARLNALAAVHHRDRRPGYPFHPRPFET